jgi:UDP-N-acetylglucosamine 1-carboxyvinyltransferase
LIGGVLTRGDVTIEQAGGSAASHLASLLEKLHEAGATVSVSEQELHVRLDGELRARDVITAPHPGFPTDLQAQYLALMSQATGSATVCETVFENRFQHVAELVRMGADITVDGHVARVHGPQPLSGARVMATDLRASASLVLAGLTAEGETVVDRIYHLDRGYAAMESKLQRLGGRVERRSESMAT